MKQTNVKELALAALLTAAGAVLYALIIVTQKRSGTLKTVRAGLED